MAISAEGRKIRELEGLIKSAASDYRRYDRECAKWEIKLMNAERMKAVCKESLAQFEHQLVALSKQNESR